MPGKSTNCGKLTLFKSTGACRSMCCWCMLLPLYPPYPAAANPPDNPTRRLRRCVILPTLLALGFSLEFPISWSNCLKTTNYILYLCACPAAVECRVSAVLSGFFSFKKKKLKLRAFNLDFNFSPAWRSCGNFLCLILDSTKKSFVYSIKFNTNIKGDLK